MDELSLYRKVLGVDLFLNKKISSPFRRDSSPSFGLFKGKGNRIYWKDFGSGEGGDIKALCKKLNIAHPESISVSASWQLSTRKKVVTEVDYLSYFPQHTINYFAEYGIHRFVFHHYEVNPVSSFKAISNKGKEFVVSGGENQPIVEFSGYDFVKMYKPLTSNSWDKFISNMNENDIYGTKPIIRKQPFIFLTSGNKDVLSIFGNTGIYAACLNSETLVPSTRIMLYLKRLASQIIVAYDWDETGIRMAEKISKTYNLQWIDFSKLCPEGDMAHFFKTVWKPTEMHNRDKSFMELAKSYIRQ